MGLNIQDLAVSSPDIAANDSIHERFAADTGNETPRIRVSGAPAGAVELALILHDPDAPLPNGFTHWVVYGIDPATAESAENRKRTASARMGSARPRIQGRSRRRGTDVTTITSGCTRSTGPWRANPVARSSSRSTVTRSWSRIDSWATISDSLKAVRGPGRLEYTQ